MLYLLRKSQFNADTNAAAKAVHTKWYQHAAATQLFKPYLSTSGHVADIGPHSRFDELLTFTNARRVVIDPYDNAEGAGLDAVPSNLPYPLALYRCLLGIDSQIIPDGLLEFSFSISVLEHIGQAEAGYDCNPTDNPPEAQERIRRSFCQELYRVTMPGKDTIHFVDHAARNLTFAKNFVDAGFDPIDPSQTVSVTEALHDEDAIRQQRQWWKPNEPMDEEEQSLHAVLVMGFRRPLSARSIASKLLSKLSTQ